MQNTFTFNFRCTLGEKRGEGDEDRQDEEEEEDVEQRR